MQKHTARSRSRSSSTKAPPDRRLYTLEVYIIGGPVTEKFAKKNRGICRTIQIRGDQTLEQLHEVVFHAFDRYDEHLYQFQVGGRGPMDPKAKRYSMADPAEDGAWQRESAGDVSCTTIGSLALEVGQAFGYWFDFGDDWWHQIDVAAIEEPPPAGKYPKVIKRIGKSPPQYAAWDEEA